MRIMPLIFLLAIVYFLIAVLFYIFQRRLLYFPQKQYASPQQLGLEGVEEVRVRTSHTRRLYAWYAPAPPGRPTILYFHGNGGSLASRAPRLDFFRQHGYGVLLTTYRGYSGSSGWPAEYPIKMDALYFFHWLMARGVLESDIVLYGESLGTGVAVAVALNHHPRAIVLEAPYSSIVDVAAARFPFLPVRPFMKDRYESIRLIGRLQSPLLIVHGERDRIVPAKYARKLFQAARQPKEAAWLHDAGHNNLYSKGAFEIIAGFIERQQPHHLSAGGGPGGQ
jgi:fermentation-respiration switch protein FrsA (DUF1100 family)